MTKNRRKAASDNKKWKKKKGITTGQFLTADKSWLLLVLVCSVHRGWSARNVPVLDRDEWKKRWANGEVSKTNERKNRSRIGPEASLLVAPVLRQPEATLWANRRSLTSEINVNEREVVEKEWRKKKPCSSENLLLLLSHRRRQASREEVEVENLRRLFSPHCCRADRAQHPTSGESSTPNKNPSVSWWARTLTFLTFAEFVARSRKRGGVRDACMRCLPVRILRWPSWHFCSKRLNDAATRCRFFSFLIDRTFFAHLLYSDIFYW